MLKDITANQRVVKMKFCMEYRRLRSLCEVLFI